MPSVLGVSNLSSLSLLQKLAFKVWMISHGGGLFSSLVYFYFKASRIDAVSNLDHSQLSSTPLLISYYFYYLQLILIVSLFRETSFEGNKSEELRTGIDK